MTWRDDDQDFFAGVSGGKTGEQPSGPCEMCTTTCAQCGIPVHQHTQQGTIECAWRGHPCLTCGNPPHPDNAPGRCLRYDSPSDTGIRRMLRERSEWKRDAEGPFYCWRHCHHRRHGQRQPDPQPHTYEIHWPEPARAHRSEDDLQQLALEQVAESRASRPVV